MNKIKKKDLNTINKIENQIMLKKTDNIILNQNHPKFKTLEESINKSKNIAQLESAKTDSCENLL